MCVGVRPYGYKYVHRSAPKFPPDKCCFRVPQQYCNFIKTPVHRFKSLLPLSGLKPNPDTGQHFIYTTCRGTTHKTPFLLPIHHFYHVTCKVCKVNECTAHTILLTACTRVEEDAKNTGQTSSAGTSLCVKWSPLKSSMWN